MPNMRRNGKGTVMTEEELEDAIAGLMYHEHVQKGSGLAPWSVLKLHPSNKLAVDHYRRVARLVIAGVRNMQKEAA